MLYNNPRTLHSAASYGQVDALGQISPLPAIDYAKLANALADEQERRAKAREDAEERVVERKKLDDLAELFEKPPYNELWGSLKGLPGFHLIAPALRAAAKAADGSKGEWTVWQNT